MIEQPTIQEISENIVAQISAKVAQDFPILPKAFVRVLAKALAGVFVILFRYVGWVALQLFVQHASFRETTILGRRIVPLIELGRLVGVGDPVGSVQAELVVDVEVLNQAGSLAGQTQLLYPPTGVLYLTTAPVPLDAPVVQVTVRAASDQSGGDGSGAIGNLPPSAVLEFANRPPAVGTGATVGSVAVQGADGETEDVYRGRVFRRFQRRPQGGAYADYQAWGEEVPGVLNVYPYTGSLPGEVDVFVEATVESSGDPDGIPTTAQLEAVFDAIQADENGLASNRPVGAAVNVFPITRTAFDVVLGELIADDPPGAMASVADAVDDYLRAREPFLVGLSVLPQANRITQAGVAGVVSQIADAEGFTVATVGIERLTVGINHYTLAHGEKAKVGQVTTV